MASKFMLAKEYTEGMKAPRGLKDYNPPEGWYKSEKLDGYRAQTNDIDDTIKSRNGKLYNCPKWFMDAMRIDGVVVNMDGELFAGRDKFQQMGVVRKKVPIDEEWYNIKFYVFDLPDSIEPFKVRYQKLVEPYLTIDYKLLRNHHHWCLGTLSMKFSLNLFGKQQCQWGDQL